MDSEILNRVIQVVAGGVALNVIIQGAALWVSVKLLNYRLDQVEKKLMTYEKFSERLARIESEVKNLKNPLIGPHKTPGSTT